MIQLYACLYVIWSFRHEPYQILYHKNAMLHNSACWYLIWSFRHDPYHNLTTWNAMLKKICMFLHYMIFDLPLRLQCHKILWPKDETNTRSSLKQETAVLHSPKVFKCMWNWYLLAWSYFWSTVWPQGVESICWKSAIC